MTLPGDLLHRLIDTLKDLTFVPQRSSEGKMVFNVDHCFGIKGQGTIMTGLDFNSIFLCFLFVKNH